MFSVYVLRMRNKIGDVLTKTVMRMAPFIGIMLSLAFSVDWFAFLT